MSGPPDTAVLSATEDEYRRFIRLQPPPAHWRYFRLVDEQSGRGVRIRNLIVLEGFCELHHEYEDKRRLYDWAMQVVDFTE